MPAISNQYYGTAVSATQNIASPSAQEQLQPKGTQQEGQGTPPFSVELSQASIQHAMNTGERSESVAPELIRALNNDISRSGTEMSQAITDNHLHIAGILSGDAASSFNFFGVSMPLAESGFEFPKVQTTEAASDSGSTSEMSAQQRPPAPPAEMGTETSAESQTEPAAADTNAAPAPPPPESTSRHDQEIAQNAREAVTQDFDQFASQLSGMAMAATASPTQNNDAVAG